MNPQELNVRLDEISALLSDPNIDVQSALSLFEEGVNLVKSGYEEIRLSVQIRSEGTYKVRLFRFRTVGI